MVKVLVGSRNPVKIDAVRDAFTYYFKELDVIGIDAPSGVSHQPKNEETFTGAENRAAALRANPGEHANADFFVGIEGGVVNLYGRWFVLGAACIIDRTGRKGFGISPDMELPESILRPLFDEGLELGDVIDRITGEKNTKQKNGAVGYLTKNVITRRQLYLSGIVLALTPFLNEGLYFGEKLKAAD